MLLRFVLLLMLGLFILTMPAFGRDHTLFGDELFRDHKAVMLLIDPESGAIVDANRAASAYYGYSREQLVQMSIQQINTLSPAQVEQEFRRAVQEQRDYFQFVHRMADGNLRSVDVYSSPVVVDAKRLLFSIIHDVSQRDQLQHQIAASETRLRFAEQVASLGHWNLDLETSSYKFSEGALKVLGLEGENWEVAAILAMVVPEDQQRMVALRQALVAGQQRYRIDVRFLRPDGQLIDLHSEGFFDAENNTIFGVIHNTTPYRQAQRTLIARTKKFNRLASAGLVIQLVIIALLIDTVRRRKKGEVALRHSEQRFDDMARHNRTIIWEVDKQGRYTFVSDVAKEIWGYDPQEIVGRMHFYDLHPEEGLEEFKQRSFAVFERRENFRNLENPVMTRNGRTVWVATAAVPLLDRDGALMGYRGSDTDITERKLAQLAVQQKNEEMEQFVYSVSHDLKSPLITVQSFLGFLQKDLAANNLDRVDRSVANIQGAADKMARMLEALLQLSRIGRMDEPPTTASLEALVKGCMETLAGSIHDQQINIVTDIPPLLLCGDQLQLGRIWQNLVENAIKYMGDQPHPRIDIGVEQEGGRTVFFIRDNGMGIDPKQSERIFTIFAKVDPKSSGNGLGLALVKKIVIRYGGRIWVESAGTGSGSCFRFTLPDARVARGRGNNDR